MIISHCIIHGMRNVSEKSCRENQNTIYLQQFPPPWKSCHLWHNVEKYFRAGQVADDSMAPALSMLDT